MRDNAVYIKGSIGGTMLKTAFSMLAGTLAMSGYNIIDTYFVGRLPGASPLAAMGFTFPVIMLLGCVFHGLGVGVMATTAQAMGASRRRKAATLVTSGVLLVAVISVLLGMVGMMMCGWIFPRFGATGETLVQVKGFMNVWFLGCFTASLAMTGNDILIAVGDSKMASVMMILGMVINVILDPPFIFGWGPLPGMGIRGAAIATVISQCVSMIAVLSLLNKRHGLLRFVRIPWRKLRGSWRVMIRFAVPATLGMLMVPIGMAVVTRITAEFGDVAVAAVAAASRLEMVPFVFPMALGMSLMPMIGQNFGARLFDRIRMCYKFAMGFAFCFLIGMAAVYFVAAEPLSKFFARDPEVQQILTLCLRIIPWGFATVEIHRYAGFFFTGCGRPSVSVWLNGLRILVLLIPLSLLALWLHSLEALFFARMTADLIAGGIAFLWARHMTHMLPADGMPPPIWSSRKNWLGTLLYPALSFASWSWTTGRNWRTHLLRRWSQSKRQ